MGRIARSGVVVVLVMVAVVLFGVMSTSSLAVTLATTTALIMGGSGIGNPTVLTDAGIRVPIPNYIPNVENYYIAPNSTCDVATCRLVPVITPEGLLPPLIGSTTFDPSVAQGVVDLTTALHSQLADHPDEPVVIFGYSQSSDISTIVKRNLASDPTATLGDQVSFVLIGNTNRPNGGIFARFPGLYIPFLNITFNGATPTNTGYKTTDIAFQYDPVADFPQYPINVLADLNALAGFLGVHATYPNPYLPIPPGVPFFPTGLPDGYTPAELQQVMNDPSNRQTYGDTTYITVPAKNLPLLQPLLDIGAATGLSALTTPIVDLVQPALRVLIELGYDRTIPYGQPTPAGLFPAINPTKLATDLATAVHQGIQTALTDLGVTPTSSLPLFHTAHQSVSATAPTADIPAETTRNVTPLRESPPSSLLRSSLAPGGATPPRRVVQLAGTDNGGAESGTAANKAVETTRNDDANGATDSPTPVPSTTTTRKHSLPHSPLLAAGKPNKPTTPTRHGSPSDDQPVASPRY